MAQEKVPPIPCCRANHCWEQTHANCLDQETEYARWIVEAWEQLLERRFRFDIDPENALVAAG